MEELETVQPQPNLEQQQQDLEVMEQTPDISEDVPQSEPIAGKISMGIIKNVAKNIRGGVKVTDEERYEKMLKHFGYDVPAHVQKEKMKEAETIKKLEAEAEADRKALEAKYQNIESVEVDPYDFSLEFNSNNILKGEPKRTAESMLKGTALDPNNSWELNYKTLEETNDINMIIANQANEFKGEVDEARRDVITDEALVALSRIVGEDQDKLAQILNRQSGEVLSAEYVLASKNLVVDSANRLRELAQKVASADATPKDELALMKQQYFHKELYKSFMGLRAEYGRGLRAFGVKQGSQQYETEQISEALFDAKYGGNPKQIAEQIMNADSVRAIGDLTKASTFKVYLDRGLDAIHAWRIGSVLSGPSTQAVNAFGGAFQGALHQVDLFNSAMLGGFIDETVPFDKITMLDSKASAFAFTQSIGDSLRVAFKALKTGEEYGLGGKAEDIQVYKDPLKAENLFGVQKPNMVTKAWDMSMDVHQFMVKNVMTSTDSFHKKLAEQQELYRLAYKRAYNIAEKENLNEKEAEQLLQYMIENPNEDMVRQSTEMAKRITFQESNPDADAVLQKGFGNRVMRNVMMFRKTPTNIFRQAFIDRNPAMAVLSKKFRDDFKAGGERKQMALGRIATGAEIFGLGMYLANEGIITGATPTDPRERELWEQQGKKATSVKLANGYVFDYSKFEPLSNIFATIATVADHYKKASYYDLDDTDEESQNKRMASVIFAIASQTLDKSFLTGVKDVMDAMQSVDKADYFVNSVISSMTPMSGMRRNLKYMMDSETKVYDDTWEYLKSTTPILDQDLKGKRDFFGEPIKKEQYANPVKVYQTKVKHKKIVDLAEQIMRATNKTFLKKPARTKNGKKVKARDYNEYVEFARKKLEVKDKGVWIKFPDLIKEVMKTEGFDRIAPEKKLEILNKKISYWDSKAWEIFISSKPKLKKQYQLDKIRTAIHDYSYRKGVTLEEAKKRKMKEYEADINMSFQKGVDSMKNTTWRSK